MKIIVTIKENHFKIEMKPETDFEKTLIENTERESKNVNLKVSFSTNSLQENHVILIESEPKLK